MLTVLAVALLAALPTYTIARGAGGVGRISLACLAGFMLGIVAAVLLAIAIESATQQRTNVIGLGAIGSILGPLAGAIWASRKRASKSL